jgi:hypothetical protein
MLLLFIILIIAFLKSQRKMLFQQNSALLYDDPRHLLLFHCISTKRRGNVCCAWETNAPTQDKRSPSFFPTQNIKPSLKNNNISRYLQSCQNEHLIYQHIWLEAIVFIIYIITISEPKRSLGAVVHFGDAVGRWVCSYNILSPVPQLPL